MTNDKIRVLVADGHALLRQGLKRILESRDAIILEDCVKGEEDSGRDYGRDVGGVGVGRISGWAHFWNQVGRFKRALTTKTATVNESLI